MEYSHWLSPGVGPESGTMGCMVLRRTCHTAPDQEQGPEQEQGMSRSGPRHSQCEWFLQNIGPCSGPRDSQCEYPIRHPHCLTYKGWIVSW